MMSARMALGVSLTLQWNANPASEHVTGYRLYYGTVPGVYTDRLDVGNVTTKTVANLIAGQTYFFAVSAFSGDFESPRSTEIFYAPANFTVAVSSPSGAVAAAGGSVTCSVAIARTPGSTASIVLNATGLPDGAYPPRFSTNPIQAMTSMTLTLCSTVPPGSYPFTVVGVGCGGGNPSLTRTATGVLVKNP